MSFQEKTLHSMNELLSSLITNISPENVNWCAKKKLDRGRVEYARKTTDPDITPVSDEVAKESCDYRRICRHAENLQWAKRGLPIEIDTDGTITSSSDSESDRDSDSGGDSNPDSDSNPESDSSELFH